MEPSILTSTKKILGLDADYTAFDLDVITCINSAFSTLNQIGVGPIEGFSIEDDGAKWEDLGEDFPLNQLSMIKTYIFLKTRFLFDTPATSFLIDAMKNQIEEHEWRLREFREEAIAYVPPVHVFDDEEI